MSWYVLAIAKDGASKGFEPGRTRRRAQVGDRAGSPDRDFCQSKLNQPTDEFKVMPGWDAAKYLKLVRNETRGVFATLARASLSLAAMGYGAAVRFRNAKYDRGGSAVHVAPVPVVSVGNLTLGGTGKTPTVEWISRWFRNHDLRVAILSRGYGDFEGANDEALVLEENLPDVPHLQDRDRVALAKIAVEELESQVLILDDGYQHRRLARDLDLVLIDALDPFGLGRIFPRGLLREPLGSLRRADIVAITRADLIEPAELARIRTRLTSIAPKVPVFESRFTPIALVNSAGEQRQIIDLQAMKVVAFCGIGNPQGFRKTLEPLVGSLADLRVFRDHHPYQTTDLAGLANWVRGLEPDLVLTTQKDLVKLRVAELGGKPMYALRIGWEPLDGREHLIAALRSIASRVEQADASFDVGKDAHEALRHEQTESGQTAI